MARLYARLRHARERRLLLVSPLHSRVVVLTCDSSGSAAGTISVSPSRYAGSYYTFESGLSPAQLQVVNLRRALLSKLTPSNSDDVQDVLPTTSMDLTSGEEYVL